MGQKIHPKSLRLGINKTWSSKWYVDPREYANTLHEDIKLRKTLLNHPAARNADIAEVEIVRHPQQITIIIHTSLPGIIIGTKGATIEKIGAALQKITDKKIQLKIKEIKKPEIDAQIIAFDVARKLKGRASFRRTLKIVSLQAMKNGAQGIKILIAGRLGGAEMSRRESIRQGRVPLHTFRANIDYGFAEARTTFGVIGVKVWVFKGEVLKRETKEDAGSLVRKRKDFEGGRR
ncbi:MAG: 30S ribosomal protein S3 [Salinispira sp.]